MFLKTNYNLNRTLKRQLERTWLKREKKNKDKLENNPQSLLPFTLKFFRKKATRLKSNHHSPKEHLKITQYSKGQYIFLVLLSLISTHQFTTMDHDDSYTHLSTFYELVGQWNFNKVILNLFICVWFPFH